MPPITTAIATGIRIHQSVDEASQVAAPECKARVVERRDGQERPAPRRAQERIVQTQPKAQADRGGDQELHHGRERRDPEEDPAGVVEVDDLHVALADQAAAQAETSAEHKEDHRRRRHDRKAAELDQHEDHDLTKWRPIGGGVHQRVARHAYGCRRREQRGQQRRTPGTAMGNRERKQQRANEDRDREREGHQLPGVQRSEESQLGQLLHGYRPGSVDARCTITSRDPLPLGPRPAGRLRGRPAEA